MTPESLLEIAKRHIELAPQYVSVPGRYEGTRIPLIGKVTVHLTNDRIEASIVDQSNWNAQMMLSAEPGTMVSFGDHFRDVAPGMLVGESEIGIIFPDSRDWEARGPISIGSQHQTSQAGSQATFTFRINQLIVHGPAYGSTVAATRYVYSGGDWGAKSYFAGRPIAIIAHAIDPVNIETEVISATVMGALDEVEREALWLALSFISGKWLKTLSVERYDQHGVLIEAAHKRGGRSATNRDTRFHRIHAPITTKGIGVLGDGFLRLLRAGFPIDVIIEHMHAANTGNLDIDAEHLTLAIHTAIEAWNLAFGTEHWIDDDCWEWFTSKARRPLLNPIYDTIGPDVKANLALAFRHANRTTTSWREKKLFEDLKIDVSSTDEKRALAARDEILHNGYFLKRWRHLTTPERQQRRDDVARLRRLALLIIFRLTAFEGQFLSPLRFEPERVLAVQLPDLIQPPACVSDADTPQSVRLTEA